VLICTSCGHENGKGAKFCEECGVAIVAASPRTQEQRKTVTVLFCDLTGSTELGESLDPDRKSTRLNSSHTSKSRMPSSA